MIAPNGFQSYISGLCLLAFLAINPTFAAKINTHIKCQQ